MNNEPVAWMNVDEDGDCREFFAKSMFKTMPNYCVNDMIPLYTHPAKTLTDEEIEMLAYEYNLLDDYPHEFARAILKKWSEK